MKIELGKRYFNIKKPTAVVEVTNTGKLGLVCFKYTSGGVPMGNIFEATVKEFKENFMMVVPPVLIPEIDRLCDKCGCPINPNEPGTHHVGKKISHARCGPLDAGLPKTNPHKRDDVMSYNVGDSNYAKKKIQPWDIWEEYQLSPWDADIVKRVLRDKSSQSRREDYEKIKHICDKRISQIDNNIKAHGFIPDPVICDQCYTAFSDKYNYCPVCGGRNET